MTFNLCNNKGHTARFNDSEKSAITWHQSDKVMNHIPHTLPRGNAFYTVIDNPSKTSLRVLDWELFKSRVSIFTAVNVITWDQEQQHRILSFSNSSSLYSPVTWDNGEVLCNSAISGVDEETKTFTITNSLNQLGPGHSGALVILELSPGESVIIGRVNSLVKGKLGFSSELRCIHYETSSLEKFSDDTDISKPYSNKGVAEVKNGRGRGLRVSVDNIGTQEYSISPSPHDKSNKYHRNESTFYETLGFAVKEYCEVEGVFPQKLELKVKCLKETYTLTLID